MSKRTSSEPPSFPDSTGWSPRAGSVRGQVLNRTKQYCDEYYWAIVGDNGKLSYYEYEDPVIRAEANKAYLAKSKGNYPKTPSTPSTGATTSNSGDADLRGMLVTLTSRVSDLQNDNAALRVHVEKLESLLNDVLAGVKLLQAKE